MTHYEHPDDNAYNLCGGICTRDNAQTTRDDGENVDCVACIVLESEGRKAEL